MTIDPDLPGMIRQEKALRRMRDQRWNAPADPLLLRLERRLAPLGRALRRLAA